VRSGDATILNVLHDTGSFPSSVWESATLDEMKAHTSHCLFAAESGHLPVLEWLFEHSSGEVGRHFGELMSAASGGHLELVEWISQAIPENSPRLRMTSDNIASLVSKPSNIKIVEWLYNRYGGLIDINSCEGKMCPDVARWMASMHPDWLDNTGAIIASMEAVQFGNKELLTWLWANSCNVRTHWASEFDEFAGQFTRAGNSLYSASSSLPSLPRKSCLEMTEWVFLTGGSVFDSLSDDKLWIWVWRAAERYQMDTVEWLLCHYYDREKSMQFAAQWLLA